MTVVRMDSILLEMARFYHRLWSNDNPGANVGFGVIAMGTLAALEHNGDAEKIIDPDGSVTWHATPKFLSQMKREAGSLVSFGPEIH
jgi:hypothetical protein